MASKVNILGKKEDAREGHIKGDRIYQGRKLQGIAEKKGRTQETQGKERREERKKDSGKETSWKKERRIEGKKDGNGNKKTQGKKEWEKRMGKGMRKTDHAAQQGKAS